MHRVFNVGGVAAGARHGSVGGLRTILRDLAGLFLSARCAACGVPAVGRVQLCPACRRGLAPFDPGDPSAAAAVPTVGLVGWRGMVGSVLMQRMLEENDFDQINEPVFFTTSQVGQAGPEIGKEIAPLK